MTHHHKRTALERAVARQDTLINDVARSVNATVPSGKQDISRPRAAARGEGELDAVAIDSLWHFPEDDNLWRVGALRSAAGERYAFLVHDALPNITTLLPVHVVVNTMMKAEEETEDTVAASLEGPPLDPDWNKETALDQHREEESNEGWHEEEDDG